MLGNSTLLAVLVVSIIYVCSVTCNKSESFKEVPSKSRTRRSRRREEKVPCDIKEKEQYKKNPQANKKCTGNMYDKTNNRGLNKMSSLQPTTHNRRLRAPDRVPSNRKSMGIKFNPEKPLEERDFLNANLGHVIMPEQLPKRMNVADIRGTPYIKLGASDFAGGGALDTYYTREDTKYTGFTKM